MQLNDFSSSQNATRQLRNKRIILIEGGGGEKERDGETERDREKVRE